jgi:hypothetical protein
MLYVFLHIWPWILAALALGAFTGIFAGRLSVQSLPPKRTEVKRVVKEPKELKEPVPATAPTPAAATPDLTEALAKQKKELEEQLAARDAVIADIRAGLDRELALRRAAIARIEGLMVEQQAQAPTRPIKGSKASAKSSPSH